MIQIFDSSSKFVLPPIAISHLRRRQYPETMSTATTTTTTAIELTSQNLTHIHASHTPHHAAKRHDDPVLAASQAADMTVPDGEYGWVIVGACAVVVWWAIGTTYSWGVLQEALVAQGLSSPAVLSFIGGLDAALISALAIVNSRLIRSLGVRTTCLCGVTLMGMSEILSGFAVKNLGALFFTSGVLMGLGVR